MDPKTHTENLGLQLVLAQTEERIRGYESIELKQEIKTKDKLIKQLNKELNVVNLVFDGGSVKELDEYCKSAKKQIAELEIYIENLKATIKSLKVSLQK